MQELNNTLELNKYCNTLFAYQRFKTREVMVGSVGIGGMNPIRVQSMTTADTMDTQKTIEECIRMIDAGCEIVRITAPSIKEALNLAEIKKGLLEKGYSTPLVADIHFTPNAAEVAATIVEKVRVNPGNYADKKRFEHIEYTSETYSEELERIRKKFEPLVEICKKHGTAMRIGTNHGSLSDRILSRYGDTPEGMVESAMEFIRICRNMDYHNLVISMKASNTLVMVQAYRLLVAEMIKQGMDYPLHLGVTEAGDGEDGRVKSAVGIGALLEDGLGDTVRVSLTEAAENEIPVAQKLVNRYTNRTDEPCTEAPLLFNPYASEKLEHTEILNIGSKNVPVIIHNLADRIQITPASFYPFGYNYSVDLDKWNILDQACDYVYLGAHNIEFEIPGTLGVIQDFKTWQKTKKERHYPLISETDLKLINSTQIAFVKIDAETADIESLKEFKKAVLLITSSHQHAAQSCRSFVLRAKELGLNNPVIAHFSYQEKDEETTTLNASTDCGLLLVDGLIDGIYIESNLPTAKANSLAFGILQAARSRISKTEYISCPSCGRTLFDLQETTAKIRSVTHHLKGVKIGIMGCIVNGPGEMADADYGYVGTGPGKITLYKEKEVVKKNIPEIEAVQELINLIKEYGDWVEPLS